MKKSTLLSFVTAGAIVATSVGTYAAWDTLEVKTEGVTMNYAEGVVVSVNAQPSELTGTLGGINGTNEATSTFTINVAGIPTEGTNAMNLTAVDDNDQAINQEGLTFTFQKEGKDLTNGIDSNVQGSNEYTVKVTLDTTKTDKSTMSTKVPEFHVKATLDHTASAA